MATIQADVDGLNVFATRCAHHVGQMCDHGPAPAVGGQFQATSAAVSAVHAAADAVEAALAARLSGTASAVTGTATSFAKGDATNADTIGSVAL
jgi:hypothetical protein